MKQIKICPRCGKQASEDWKCSFCEYCTNPIVKLKEVKNEIQN